MKTRGLTLGDLLVMLSILLVTSAIVVAVFGPTIRATAMGTCKTHLKDLHQSFTLYRIANGGSDENSGDIYKMGLPKDAINWSQKTPIVGDYSDWSCPAPKNPQIPPARGMDYIYVPYADSPSVGAEEYFSRYVAKFRDETPLLYDIHHNDHRKVDIFSRRHKARVLLVNLGGTLKVIYAPNAAEMTQRLSNFDPTNEGKNQ